MPNAAPKPQIKIAAHVVIQLGQELVTDVEQAFLELAKNAYDADSESCEITIEPDWYVDKDHPSFDLLDPRIRKNAPVLEGGQKVQVGRVVVEDRGTGASEEGIADGWLTISASLKRDVGAGKKKTEKGRTPVGDKGLGRLATMKIGDVLEFNTHVEGEKVERTTSFAWSKFAHVKTLDQVTVLQRQKARPRPYFGGSRIEIIGLHEPHLWTEKRVLELVARLSVLVNPFVEFKDFDLSIVFGKKTYNLQKIAADVLNFAAARFEFQWDGQQLKKSAHVGRALFRGTRGEDPARKFETLFSEEVLPKLKRRILDGRRLRNRGVFVERTRNWFFGCSEESRLTLYGATAGQNPGPFSAEIYYFMFNEEFTNKIHGTAVSSEQIRQMSGLLVFRDGFRVRMGDDWLGLSEGTTTGGFYNLRPKNTLGYFAISNEGNPKLVEKSDREGFVDNAALRGFMSISSECKKYANEILNAARDEVNEFYNELELDADQPATPRVARAKAAQAKDAATSEVESAKEIAAKAMLQVSRLKSVIRAEPRKSNAELSTALGTLSRSFEQIEEKLSGIRDKVVELDTSSGAMERFRRDEASRNLRLLESAAVGLSARSLAHELSTYVDELEAGIRSIAQRNRELKDSDVRDALGKLTSALRELRKTLGALNPLLPGARSIREKLDLEQAVSEFVASRTPFAEKERIAISVRRRGPSADFKFNRTRFFQILENLFQNSIYWLSRGTPAGHSKSITVSLRAEGLDWSDTGPGVDPRYQETLFDPFVSGKPGTDGKGLGLYIVSTFLEAERCSIELLPETNAQGRRYKFRVDLSGAMS